MESQEAVPRKVQRKLFFITLGTTFVAIATPIALASIPWPTWFRTLVAVLAASIVVFGVRQILLLARTPGAKLFERSSHASLTVALTAALIVGMVGSGIGHINERCNVTHSVTTYPGGSELTSETEICSHGGYGYLGLAVLAVALLVVFIGLTFIPSTERELRRRIDLEASSITLGTTVFFFFFYPALKFVLPLPAFSELVAILSIIVVYLLARLVASIRYR